MSTRELHLIVGLREESYEGEYGPEVLDCWDDFTLDENPEGFREALACGKTPGTGRAGRRTAVSARSRGDGPQRGRDDGNQGDAGNTPDIEDRVTVSPPQRRPGDAATPRARPDERTVRHDPD